MVLEGRKVSEQYGLNCYWPVTKSYTWFIRKWNDNPNTSYIWHEGANYEKLTYPSVSRMCTEEVVPHFVQACILCDDVI